MDDDRADTPPVMGHSVAPKVPQNLSSIPWRKAGVKYTQNEIYFDIIEEIDATIAQ